MHPGSGREEQAIGQPKRLLGGLQTNRLLASTGANQDHISSV